MKAAAPLRALGATLFDYATMPLLLCGAVYLASLLQLRGVPNLLVTPLIVGPFTAAIALLERLRPDQPQHTPLDQPLYREALHFVFNFELGYGLSLLITALFERWVRRTIPTSIWPADWPLVVQILFATVMYESTSYWQHRLIHRVPFLWRFHALHHSGARLNFVRSVRFHFVDIGSAGFISYIPLVLLATPERVVTLVAVMLSIIGLLQHANIRMRSPFWLDRLICTPAVHRHHHSSVLHESDSNYGNTVMLFDLLFGSYGKPRPVGPAAMGIVDDPVPRTFWGQMWGPFRRSSNQRPVT